MRRGGARRVLAAVVLLVAALPAPPALTASSAFTEPPALPEPPALTAPSALTASPAPRPCASNPLCVCSGDHLACSHVPFYRFPETESWVRHVSVWRARLGALGQSALDARPLRTLVLAACRLARLHPAALASMETTLASLDLGSNEFTELPIESLRGLKVLNWLNLQNNFISELDENMDWGHLSESLTSLTLSNNYLNVIPQGAFSSLRRLVRLDLDGNGLRVLATSALPSSLGLLRLTHNLLPHIPCLPLPRLRHLHLRDNLIRHSYNDTCSREHSKVDSLDLSQNDLEDHFQFDFLSKFQLKQLILDLNDFTKIPNFPSEGVRLEKLSISHNQLKDVSDAVIQALKHDLEHLDLDHNDLTSLPSTLKVLSRLRYLSVAYNSLEELVVLPPHLSSLSAAGNYLSSFPVGLRTLTASTLGHLDLGYNKITSVPRDTFGPWSAALDTLNLRGNQITQLAAEVFPATLPVRELALSFNDLYFIDPNAFANLTNLRVLELTSTLFNGEFPIDVVSADLNWLTLNNNNIHHVTSSDLHSFPSLEYLNLDFNKIVEFPSETNYAIFNYTSIKLKELRLSYNYIRKLNPEFFINLTELESIDLSYNRMHNISERCFGHLRNLIYLSLAGNVLEFVADRAFYDLPKLEVLDLQENFLAEFSTKYFSELSSEEIALAVNVSHNRISSLVGGSTVFIAILDLSHNLIGSLSKSFFESLGRSIRQIILTHNRLLHIDSFCIGTLPKLQILNLSNNSISSIKRRVFTEVPSLQILDLSHNKLSQLAIEQFHNVRQLRHLRLDANELRALPRNCFKNTLLEHVDLGHNQLAMFPSSALAHVGFTLRRLNLADNRLEYLDSAMFHSISFLYELNLSRNALTVLSDNTFSSLSRLARLDLSQNAIKSNFKELFHSLPNLQWLSLADAGLKAMPHLPLSNLTQLDLSGNYITAYRETDVKRLINLRHLNIARNKITSLQPTMWSVFPELTHLDVSNNPLVRVTGGSYQGLDRLLQLHMDYLWQLEAIEPRVFRSLKSLRTLTLELPTGQAALANIVAEIPGLETLTLTVRASRLDAQLRGVRAPKLRVLELTGAALSSVSARAFDSLGRQRALTLRLSATGVRSLPAGLLRPLARVPLLALQLRDNRLRALEPAALYPNLTDWNRFATKLLPGGLVVSGNPLRCGCAAWWVRSWLRRWAAEVGGGGRAARAAAARSRCVAASGEVPLLTAEAEAEADAGADTDTDASRCQASALSSRVSRPLPPAPALLWIVLLHSTS